MPVRQRPARLADIRAAARWFQWRCRRSSTTQVRSGEAVFNPATAPVDWDAVNVGAGLEGLAGALL